MGFQLRILPAFKASHSSDKMKLSAASSQPHPLQLIATTLLILLPCLTLIVVHAKPDSETVENNDPEIVVGSGNVVKHRFLKPNKPQCNDRRLLKLDRYVSTIMSIGKYGRDFPINQTEYSKYCRDTTKMTAYVEKFLNDCFTIENANLAKLILFGLKRMTRVYCSEKPKYKKTRFSYRVSKCFNTAIKKDPCLPRMINSTKELVSLDIGKIKLNYMCCDFVEMLRCEDSYYNALPCSKQEDVDMLVNLIRSVTEDSLNYACGEYTEQTDRCDNIPPLDRSKTHPKLKADQRFHSIMIPALELFDSLDQPV